MLTVKPQDGFEQYLFDKAYENQLPINGTFELLPICNMNCSMCYVRLTKEEMDRQGSMLSCEQWIKIARQAVKSGLLFLLLTGGETLLYPEFERLYKELRSLGLYITINTNGTLITEKIADMFAGDLPRRVNISLYGSSDAVYEKLCHNPKGFTQVMNAIKLLKERDVPIKLNYTLTPQNEKESEKIMRISDEIGIPVSIPTYIFPPERKKGIADISSFSRLTPEAAAKKQLEILYNNFGQDEDYKQNLENILDEIMQMERQEHMDVPSGTLCSAGVSSFWIDWKGNMTPCGMMKDPSSNLIKTDFLSSWDKIKIETKKIFTSNKCFNCKYRKCCQTCAASAFAETGSYDGCASYHCEFCENYEKILKEHIEQL